MLHWYVLFFSAQLNLKIRPGVNACFRYQARLAARPILTQAVTTSILFATGDVTAQLFIEPKKEEKSFDFVRTGRMALYGGGK